MRYEAVGPIDRASAEKALASEDASDITNALIALALHDPDWRWVQDLCLDFLRHGNPDVRGLAATCLGHLARIHGQIDQEKVLPALREAATDRRTGGRATDALRDIEQYVS